MSADFLTLAELNAAHLLLPDPDDWVGPNLCSIVIEPHASEQGGRPRVAVFRLYNVRVDDTAVLRCWLHDGRVLMRGVTVDGIVREAVNGDPAAAAVAQAAELLELQHNVRALRRQRTDGETHE